VVGTVKAANVQITILEKRNRKVQITEPRLKQIILEEYAKEEALEEYAKEFNLEVGSAPYAEFVNSLKDFKTRDQLSMNFVLSQVATDRYDGWFESSIGETVELGEESFVYDFNKIDQLMKPSFVISKGTVEPTEVYQAADSTDKQILYRGYVKGILGNYLRTDRNAQQLAAAAQDFMQQIPPPSGQDPQNILNSVLKELQEFDEYVN